MKKFPFTKHLSSIGFLMSRFRPATSLKMVNNSGAYATHPLGFSQGVRLTQPDLWILSGQVGWNQLRQFNADGSFADQIAQALSNIAGILREEGLGVEAIAHLRFCVVGIDSEKVKMINQELSGIFPGEYKPATTVIGISGLARPELLIEVEAIAQCAGHGAGI